PSQANEYPPVPPESEQAYLLLILALIILALLITALILRMWDHYLNQTGAAGARLRIALMLLFLSLVFYLVLRGEFLLLGALLAALAVYVFVNKL
ncbi:MAG: hypothetical protein ACREQZ_07375, partial [Woeseiaceae bacterium]